MPADRIDGASTRVPLRAATPSPRPDASPPRPGPGPSAGPVRAASRQRRGAPASVRVRRRRGTDANRHACPAPRPAARRRESAGSPASLPRTEGPRWPAGFALRRGRDAAKRAADLHPVEQGSEFGQRRRRARLRRRHQILLPIRRRAVTASRHAQAQIRTQCPASDEPAHRAPCRMIARDRRDHAPQELACARGPRRRRCRFRGSRARRCTPIADRSAEALQEQGAGVGDLAHLGGRAIGAGRGKPRADAIAAQE